MLNTPVFINDGGILRKINLEDLLVLEVEDNYVRYITHSKEYCSKSTLENALNSLPDGSFVRVNRACAVALRHIEQMDRQHVTVGGQQLVLSRGYYKGIRERICVLGEGKKL
ncbi:LytTR family DNA-binding domain-containing protein [uncultured Chitinophaga sp.]|uniref:LytR/AlgR family response regulator transcription factor n=1 Tax=uncultured Chitinophaga sp. TaxID=339340 RepID=UPI0025E53B49|nr:LytTR family DNA-binding domain-containing protein [uncultured Chitinophaga sp.]